MKEVSISKFEWGELNLTYSKEEIKEKIIRMIIDNDMELPYREVSLFDALDSFDSMLISKQKLKEGKWFTRYDYNYPFSDIIIPSDVSGNKSSDYFHQRNRWKCDSINAPSPYRTWKSEKFLGTMLNALWTMKVDHVDSNTLRTMIGLRKYIASQFRPTSARDIYDHFNAINVLDFSSGWGDRLSGFMASSAETYTGVDPNINLTEGYYQQIKKFGIKKQIIMMHDCAENVNYGLKMFDFIFTSPPYFNIERYTQDDNQSFKKFKKLDAWLEGFLFKSIQNAWNHLEVGGHMAINISDVYSNHTVNKICDPMNDFISTLKGSEYFGCYGYQMRKRPNSGALKGKHGVFAEPVWIWKKVLD